MRSIDVILQGRVFGVRDRRRAGRGGVGLNLRDQWRQCRFEACHADAVELVKWSKHEARRQGHQACQRASPAGEATLPQLHVGQIEAAKQHTRQGDKQAEKRA